MASFLSISSLVCSNVSFSEDKNCIAGVGWSRDDETLAKYRFTGVARPLAPFQLSALQLTAPFLWVLSELSEPRRKVGEKEKELQMNKNERRTVRRR
jgi:hypothetical protein